MDQQTTYIVILVLLVIFLIGTYVFKRPEGTPRIRAVMGILSDVSDNLKILEDRTANPRLKAKFRTANWQRFNGKLAFLDDEVVESVGEAFNLATEFNARKGSALKNDTLDTIENTQAEKFKEQLTKSKKGLSDWMRANYQTEMQNKKRGFFG
jgi:hypothetical protein